MATIESSFVVNRPVKEVFEFLTDVGNFKEWQAGVSEANITTDGPLGVGSRITAVSEVMGRKYEAESEVAAYVPNKKWGIKTQAGPSIVEMTYTFESITDGTEVEVMLDVPMDGYPGTADIVKQQMKKQMEEQNAALKKRLEA